VAVEFKHHLHFETSTEGLQPLGGIVGKPEL
jgi:hypothetical protein